MIFSSKFQVNFTNKSHLSLKKRLIYYSFLFLFHQWTINRNRSPIRSICL